MNEIRAAHKKVIAFGSFDPLHKGHLDFFKQAKMLGDFLVVVVARDENIRKDKHHEPMLSEKQRAMVVSKSGIADKVMIGDKLGEYEVLEREKPDIIALGYDQKIPELLKNKVKKYKIITLKPFKPQIYKSSKIKKSEDASK